MNNQVKDKHKISGEARSNFSVKSWKETDWDSSLPRCTSAEVVYKYQGDLRGESLVRYLMCYTDDKTGSFTALEKFKGEVFGLSGSFSVLHNGSFSDGRITAVLSVISDSGTDELTGLQGECQAVMEGHQESYSLVFRFQMTE